MAITKVTGDVIADNAIDHDQLANRNGSSGSFRKISGTYSDTVKNLIEFKFVSTSEAFYQISQEAT